MAPNSKRTFAASRLTRAGVNDSFTSGRRTPGPVQQRIACFAVQPIYNPDEGIGTWDIIAALAHQAATQNGDAKLRIPFSTIHESQDCSLYCIDLLRRPANRRFLTSHLRRPSALGEFASKQNGDRPSAFTINLAG